jgi:ADP-dependent phosphofructokinase/glucokinase
MQIANIIYKIYSPPQSAGKNLLRRSREAAFRYDMDCEQLEIKDILAYQEDINTHYMGEKIAIEQDGRLVALRPPPRAASATRY